MAQTEQGSSHQSGSLRRRLSIWEAIGLSVALMAPSMAININPQGTAQSVGRAVPLAFALAFIGVLLVSWTFVKLCQRFHHAGSVYGFVGATLGPRTGVVSGWALLGTYTFYGVVTSTACGILGTSFLESVGIWPSPPWWGPFVISGLAILGVLWLMVSPVQVGTRTLLAVEGITVLLIISVCVVILIRLLTGNSPNGQEATWSVFTVPHGTGSSAVFLGVVFGFLSFAGFEAAATLGEEARKPRKDIPRAILGTAIFGGLYYVFCTSVEVMGFGANAQGMKNFIGSGSLLGDLSRTYLAAWIGDLITLGASVSAFACALASGVGASRMLFALSRDGVVSSRLSSVSTVRGTPVAASILVVAGIYAFDIASAAGVGAKPFDIFSWSATIGTLVLLVVYILAGIGAIRLVYFAGARTTPWWQIVIPCLGLLVLGYTLYRNILPYPSGAAAWFPVVSGVWILLAVALVWSRPTIARRAGERLTADEGLTTASATAETRIEDRP